MPLQNRVTPSGHIIATPERGTMMGIRGGCFHRDDKTLKARHWASKRWICCVLEFKNRRRLLMRPRHYTELFFLDEATAISAGHRPCFECRRADATRFAELWTRVQTRGEGRNRAMAGDMDDVLHRARLLKNGQPASWAGPIDRLPDGVFVRLDETPYLILANRLLPWSPAGYGSPIPRPTGASAALVPILTPQIMIAVMDLGYRPQIHPSALTAA